MSQDNAGNVSRETEQQDQDQRRDDDQDQDRDDDGGNVSRETEQQDQDQDQDQDSDDDDQDQDSDDDSELQQSFDRAYVEKLRSKSANYRLRMKQSEKRVSELERALWTERLKRLDMVVDPEAVPYDAELLDDEAATVAAIEDLLKAKPYLRKRKAGGDIGQHDSRQNSDGFSLSGALRANAG